MRPLTKSHTKITEARLSQISINIPTQNNKILARIVEEVNKNNEIKALWKVMNVNAIDRLEMTDHGPTHFQIVASNAIKMARIFGKKEIKFSIVKDFALTDDHAETVIFLASIMHDLGMSIHREGHEEFSLFLSNSLLHEILSFLPVEERVVMTSEVLHAIISHRRFGLPLTIEAGIVRIADALDMSKGRSRIPYNRGIIDIHSVSANAIEGIDIVEGRERPVEIKIHMTNPAGIFQVDDLMQEKLKGSGIEKYIKVSAYLVEAGHEKLFKEFEL
ncbi:MAG: Metal dependent phosphohydrolase [Candidatus Woesebacteria bacterium GW2011_GWB1_45_5]|uniref:Metal dependent phosphohydrolase n=1 Tax=Candidatus Woesebacteria bacterium GW2011_GWB1_45_5 TaxID=1618581 RepID=A0A0G1MNE9_9BACT|nr:MAG: Metal dependent phosphohydrolase [Candidatus Woesebacteria bacterium GW2011_GWB1_45_5]